VRSAEWLAEQDRCLHEIERHRAADESYLEEGVRLLELARNAQRLFVKQEPREKTSAAQFCCFELHWNRGELVANLRQPFDLLAQTTAVAAEAAVGKSRNLTKAEIWRAAIAQNLPRLAKLVPDRHQRPMRVLRRGCE
jgi:hypothetical protein